MENNSYLDILNKNTNLTYENNNIVEQFEFFIPKINEQYFYISMWQNEVHDDVRRENEPDNLFIMTKCFKTEDEAQRYLKVIKAKAKIELEILKENDGWKPDWNNKNLNKFYIYCDHASKNLFINSTFVIQHSNLDNIFYIKSNESAKRILEKCKKELKKYFGMPNE